MIGDAKSANGRVVSDRSGVRRVTAPFIEIGHGHRLFVRDWGEGAPVVLLAGWAMDSRVWAETMVALNSRGLRTIACDRRGHGQSSDPGEVSYDLLADDLEMLLNALQLSGVTLVCHSGAGGEAIRYVARHGASRVARIVLVGATGPKMTACGGDGAGISSAAAQAVQRQLAGDLAGWIDDNIDPFCPGANERTQQWMSNMVLDCSRRILVDFQREILASDLSAEAASLPVPVTIIHGDRDVSAPIDLTARRYAALIPTAELVVYEGVAHGVMVTHAERLAADIAARLVGPRHEGRCGVVDRGEPSD